MPDKQWCVKILAHLDQKDEIFSKDYVPPPVRKKKEEPKVLMIPANTLKGLPIKKAKKGNSRVRLKIVKDAKAKIKEMRVKEKKDAF